MEAAGLKLSLSSHTSLAAYPENKPENFVNRLPRAIPNQDRRRFRLRLDSIALTNSLADGEEPLDCDYLKIHVDEVERQREGRGYTSAAGGFTFPVGNECSSARLGFHSFSHAPPLLLCFQHLDKLRIRLTDLHDKPVKLASGFPTQVQVTIMGDEGHGGHGDQFTVTCNSLQPEIFPTNTLNSFSSPMPAEVDLSQYEVCLQQIVFPPRLREEECTATLIVNHSIVMTFNLTRLRTTEAFIRAVSRRVEHHYQVGWQLRFGVATRGPLAGKAYLTRDAEAGSDRPMTISCNEAFSRACGQTQETMDERSLPPGASLYFQGFPNIFYALPCPLAMLECDIVRDNVMGSTPAHLLQCVPLIKKSPREGEEEESDVYRLRLYDPPVLSYHAVTRRPFNVIRFTLRNSDGSLRKLIPTSPEDCIIVTLSFRRRRSHMPPGAGYESLM